MAEIIDFEIVKNENDVLDMLDSLLEQRESEWWSEFYSDQKKPIPFFVDVPDETLVSYVESGILTKGKALDVGCGNGRNAIYLAQKGYQAIGIDFSQTSIEWARKTADEKTVEVNFLCQSIYDFADDNESFDLVYDGGCFHHIKPHRRQQYLRTILKYLKPGGYYAMTCFNLEGGANLSDYDVYRGNSMAGGLGFSEYKLKSVLAPYFEIVEFKEMVDSNDEDMFGESFLWSVLMKPRVAMIVSQAGD